MVSKRLERNPGKALPDTVTSVRLSGARYYSQAFIGTTINCFTVLSAVRAANRTTNWVCRCVCGKIKQVNCSHVASSYIVSCGCLRSWLIHKNGKRDRGPLYSRYSSMKRRCYDPKRKDYKYYGGRGIIIEASWRYSFSAFKKWALSNGFQPHLTLERKDVNGNYSPSNCCWVTWLEQAKNKRPRHKINEPH